MTWTGTSTDDDELRDVLDALPDLVATFDEERRLLFLNASGRRLLAWNLPGMKSLPVLEDLFGDAKEAARIHDTALAAALTQGRWTGTASLQPAAGDPLAVSLSILRHPSSPSKSRAFTVLARPCFDSTREKTVRLVHDLNNLIGPILGYSELVAARVEAESPLRRFVGSIRDAAERARVALSRFSSEEPGRSYFQVVDLAELAEEATSWTRAEFPRARIDVRAPTESMLVHGDPGRLQQVVLNLCRNAVESLRARDGTVDVRVAFTEPEGNVGLTVADDGCGIEPDELSRIFQPHRSSKSEARGLGLALTREIVCSHGGTIRAESTPGKGSRFLVELPAYRPRKEC